MKIIYNTWDSRIFNQFVILYLGNQHTDHGNSKYHWNRTCLSDT